MAPKLIEASGQAKPNSRVIRELAKRLGVEHAFFEVHDSEQVEALLKDSDYPTAAEFEQRVRLDCAFSEDKAHFRKGFDQADKRFHFRADLAAVGDSQGRLLALPGFVAIIDAARDSHPFRLVTAPARWFLNTSFTEVENGQRKEGNVPHALVHPDDLAEINVLSGEELLIGNQRAQLRLVARAFDGLQRGVVVVHSVWPGYKFKGGMGINALVGADSPPPNGGAAFHDTAVWLKAVSA